MSLADSRNVLSMLMLLFTFETLRDLLGRKLIYVGYFIVCFYLYMYYR
jgi:hypothetical protein